MMPRDEDRISLEGQLQSDSILQLHRASKSLRLLPHSNLAVGYTERGR